MPRPSNTEIRRAEIIEGLLEVIVAEGYEGASVARIARAAGLTPGLVHYHFGNKEEVLYGLLDRLAALVQSRFTSRVARSKRDPRAELDAFIDAHLALGEDADPRAAAAWVVIGAEALRRDELRERYRAVLKQRERQLSGIVRDCLGGAGSGLTEAQVVAGILAAIEGAFGLASVHPESMPAGRAAQTVRVMAHALLEAAE